MFEYRDFDNDPDEFSQESYPDFYYDWDEILTKNLNPYFFDSEEFSEIIELYLNDGEILKAKQTIQYALKFHPEDADLIFDILLFLNDFELWNDLLKLSEQYKDISKVWADGHKVTALLHLGMEEDAFLFFRKLKTKYEKNKEDLSIIYQAMGEALNEVDLFDACIDVIDEILSILGPNVDFYWLKLQSYFSLNLKEEVLKIANQIEQIKPLDAENWYRLGKIYSDIDEMEKAIDAFEFVESLGNIKSINYITLITAYEKNGNYLKALEKAKDYLYLYPENCMMNVLAANICSKMEMWEEALFYVNVALKIVPGMDELYLYKSNVFLNLGEQKKAISVLEEGIRLTSDQEGDLKKELERLQNQYPN
ncbi:MAG: hypothetical protein LBG15_12030 [Dysgonamonadaceae bacterium]|jgi:tetratricopeptide (TPR) repeat protein|nr:hypothetical protein [Dysgonamonadaceae bacterium]